MSDLKRHIDEMILLYGDVITTHDIKEYYAKTFGVILNRENILCVKNFIYNNYPNYTFNEKRESFESDSSGERFLFVEDGRVFNNIDEIMREVFGFSKVQRQRGYFRVLDDPIVYAWFPQFGNKKWENLFLENGAVWTETYLSDEKQIIVPNNELRYIFSHEKDGYRFTGLFVEKEIVDGKTRIYKKIDNKIDKTAFANRLLGGVITEEVDQYIKQIIDDAKENGERHIVIGFSTVKARFGERVRHRAPIVCNAIRKHMTHLDTIVYESPKGSSSLFEVDFDLSDK